MYIILEDKRQRYDRFDYQVTELHLSRKSSYSRTCDFQLVFQFWPQMVISVIFQCVSKQNCVLIIYKIWSQIIAVTKGHVVRIESWLTTAACVSEKNLSSNGWIQTSLQTMQSLAIILFYRWHKTATSTYLQKHKLLVCIKNCFTDIQAWKYSLISPR